MRARDTIAHRALFDQYYPKVRAFVRRRLEDPELTDEVASDVFLEVWRSAGRYSGKSRVSTWIFGIAQMKSMAARRSAGRLKRQAVVPMNVEELQAVGDPGSTPDQLEVRALLRQIADLVNALPPGQREALQLAFVEDLDYQEIGERLGISPGTVKSRISRARDRLRSELREDSETSGES